MADMNPRYIKANFRAHLRVKLLLKFPASRPSQGLMCERCFRKSGDNCSLHPVQDLHASRLPAASFCAASSARAPIPAIVANRMLQVIVAAFYVASFHTPQTPEAASAIA